MNILKIYQKYLIPENLQNHMLRVAACGKLIINNWAGPQINGNSILRILLLHDMGNIVKITPDQNNDLDFLRFRQKCIEQYGNDDHKITNIICKREGLTEKEIEIMDAKILKNNEKTEQINSYEIKICAYCDQRVAPNGVEDLATRLKELQIRHQKNGKGSMSNSEQANKLIKSALGIEKQIMKYCKIQPSDINDKTIQEYLEDLKLYEIEKNEL